MSLNLSFSLHLTFLFTFSARSNKKTAKQKKKNNKKIVTKIEVFRKTQVKWGRGGGETTRIAYISVSIFIARTLYALQSFACIVAILMLMVNGGGCDNSEKREEDGGERKEAATLCAYY